MIRVLLTVSVMLTAMLAVSCKRETRNFHVPPSAAEAPENVPANNDVRPGPQTQPTETSIQPVHLGRRIQSPYGSQFPNNAQALSDGQRLYEQFNCVGCHAHGGGGMGPPLLDSQWFYGSDPQQVYLSILQGRPNGMPSFRGRIPDYEIWELVAYVRSMSGQANPNAASGREEHLHAQPPPNSIPRHSPQIVPEPTTGPATHRTALSTPPQTWTRD